MLQYPPPFSDLFDGENRQHLLVGAWSREMAQSAPGSARWMGDDRTATGKIAGIAVSVPNVGIECFVYRICTRKQNGDGFLHGVFAAHACS